MNVQPLIFIYLVCMAITSIGLYAYVNADPKRLTHTQVLLLTAGVFLWPLLWATLVFYWLLGGHDDSTF